MKTATGLVVLETERPGRPRAVVSVSDVEDAHDGDLVRRVRSRDEEAFRALFREGRGSFRTWLLSTVHHRAVDAVRREEAQRRRAREKPDDAAQEDIADSVADRVDLAETRARVRTALQDIPEAQRQILELMYFGGRSQNEIAQALGLPLGTVKSRTLLGMRRLRVLLGGER